jgi:hypothetical protein
VPACRQCREGRQCQSTVSLSCFRCRRQTTTAKTSSTRMATSFTRWFAARPGFERQLNPNSTVNHNNSTVNHNNSTLNHNHSTVNHNNSTVLPLTECFERPFCSAQPTALRCPQRALRCRSKRKTRTTPTSTRGLCTRSRAVRPCQLRTMQATACAVADEPWRSRRWHGTAWLAAYRRCAVAPLCRTALGRADAVAPE